MSEILIFQFAPHEGPGHLTEFLSRLRLAHRLIAVHGDETIPSDFSHASGLVLMGGPMSANDPLPWIPSLLELIRGAMASDVPVLGHCLGAQLIAKAHGGTVFPNPVKEIGWLPVERVDSPEADDWLGGLAQQFDVFHWHGDTFTLPPGAARIISSRDCANQAFVLGKTLAVQFHVEMTEKMVRDWAMLGHSEIAFPSATVQGEAEMTSRLPERVMRLHAIADILYGRWLRGSRRI